MNSLNFRSAIKTKSLFFGFLLFLSSRTSAQPVAWNVSPFSQKVFIENNGQFDGKTNTPAKIFFGTSQAERDIFWSANGLTYRITEHYLSEEAKREIRKEKDADAVKKYVQIRFHYLNTEWIGANPSPEILSSDPVSNYFTYENPADPRKGIKSYACKKITYKNLYPGIDAEYILPEKGGIKYSLIVHPGADPSQVKMRYTGADKVSLNGNGEIEIHSASCGDYLEHQPEAYAQGGEPVSSSFSLQHDVIGFRVPSYDKTKDLIIDPWVSAVNFPAGTNSSCSAYNTCGYALCYDYAGNVWVYGGADPVYLAKYNAAGTLLWTYQVPFSAWDLVGDFDVNKTSGTAYICAGSDCTPTNPAGIPAGVVKVNSQGVQTGRFNGNTNNYEISRIRLDCSGNLYMTGGGVQSNLWQACGLDTNMSTMTGRHTTSSANGDHDECLMALDPAGNFMYVNFNCPAVNSPDFLNNNEMQKIPLPSFTPAAWTNPGPIHGFVEMTSLNYSGVADGGMNMQAPGRINIFNGMVCGNNFLYTYNGDTLKQWNKNTGALIKQIRTGGTAYVTGGLDLDLCQNVYAGIGNKVIEYDPNLNQISSYPLSNTTTYDVKVDGNRNQLYACGKGYVCAVSLGPPPVRTLTTSVGPASCGSCNGTASASYSVTASACSAPFTYSYKWLPGGQTTASISGLCTGTYTVLANANLNCLNSIPDTATVTVTGGGNLSTDFTYTLSCTGATFADTTSMAGITWNWQFPGGSPSSSTVQNPGFISYSPGTYTVTLIAMAGSGCGDTVTHTFTISPPPVATISPNTTICAGSSATFTAGGGSTYSWSTGSTQNPLVITPTASGTYSVIVKNAGGCADTTSASVTVNPIPVPVIQGKNPICAGSSTVLTVTGGQTFSWNTGATSSSITVTPGVTTSYSVVAFANGCLNSTAFTVSVLPPPTAVFSNSAPCEGAVVSFTDGSLPSQGDPIHSWSWSLPGGSPSTSSAQNPSIFYATSGTYTATLIITTAAGCTDSVAQKVIIYSNPVALFGGNAAGCMSICHTFIDSSQAVNGSISGWQWSFPGGNPSSSTQQNPTICYKDSGTYGASLIVTTNFGCTDTFSLNPVISIYPIPKADFCVSPLSQPATNPVFSFCDLWSPNVTTWAWTFGDGDSDQVSTDPVHSYSAAVGNNEFYTFSVCVTVQTAHGCTDAVCKTVELTPEFTFYIPNTVTPNGDGKNDFFFGKGRGIKEYDIWIFDRWGNLVWDCHRADSNVKWDKTNQDGLPAACQWDGKVVPGGPDMSGASGKLSQEDVYVWKVKLVDIFNKSHSYIGNVNMVR